MGGSQVEVIEKRRVVPDLSDLDRSIRPLIQAMLQPLPENRPASMAAVAAWGEKANSPSENEDGRAGKEWSARRSAGGQGAALIGALIAVVSLGGTGYIFRDEIVRWTQSLSGAGTPSGDQVPAPKVGVRAGIESTTTAKISPDALPQLRSELKQTAPPPLTAPPPPLTSPEGQPLTSPFPSSATSAPVPPSMKTSPNDLQMGPAAPRLPGEQSTAPSHLQPRSQEVVNALSPRASHSIIGLPAATVGTPYHAELPGFIDPSGKGLRLAANSLPEGMTFTDLGDGSGEIGGTPQRQGSADIQIVATDHIGGTARMRASVVVAERVQPAEAKALPPSGPAASNPSDGKASATPVAPEPFSPSPPTAPAVGPFEVPTKLGTQAATTPSTPPRATIPVAVLEGASAGQDFVAELPTFVTSEMAGALTLRAEPNPPPGLRLVDLGGGASQISGKPIEPGSYSFDVIATDAADLSAKMEVRLLIAPPLTPSSPGSVQLPTVSDKVSAFIHGFDGGDCFMVTPQPGIAHGYLAVGRELAPFERFDAGYKTQVGAEPQLSLRLITNSECPALDLIRQDAGAAAGRRASN